MISCRIRRYRKTRGGCSRVSSGPSSRFDSAGRSLRLDICGGDVFVTGRPLGVILDPSFILTQRSFVEVRPSDVSINIGVCETECIDMVKNGKMRCVIQIGQVLFCTWHCFSWRLMCCAFLSRWASGSRSPKSYQGLMSVVERRKRTCPYLGRLVRRYCVAWHQFRRQLCIQGVTRCTWHL